MNGGGEVHEMPFNIITRPIQSVMIEDKVNSLMETLENSPEEVPPITVLWVQGNEGGNYYFAFGGCHRYEAHKRLGKTTIKAIIQKSSIETLKHIMGESTPTLV